LALKKDNVLPFFKKYFTTVLTSQQLICNLLIQSSKTICYHKEYNLISISDIKWPVCHLLATILDMKGEEKLTKHRSNVIFSPHTVEKRKETCFHFSIQLNKNNNTCREPLWMTKP
jgi:hypothetical protein